MDLGIRRLRVFYAYLFAFMTWVAAVAAAETWYGLNPDEAAVRGGAVVVAAFVFFHVKALAQYHVTDAVHAVAFPMKLGVSIGHALFFAWLTVRTVSVATAVFIFHDNVVSEAVEFTAVVGLAWFSLAGAELLYFQTALDQKPAWLDTLVRFIRRVAQPNWEAAERLYREQQDAYRHVERRWDENEIQDAYDARRRAEREL